MCAYHNYVVKRKSSYLPTFFTLLIFIIIIAGLLWYFGYLPIDNFEGKENKKSLSKEEIRKQIEYDDEKLAQKLATEEVQEYVAQMARIGMMPGTAEVDRMLKDAVERKRKIIKARRRLIDYHDRVSSNCVGDEKEAHRIALENALNDNVDYFNLLAITDDLNVIQYYGIYLKQAKIEVKSMRSVGNLSR